MARNISQYENARPSILLISTAATLGVSIAYGRWFVLIPLLALPLVLLWPVQMSLGMFGFLLPFDSISVLQERDTGTTLTFLIGAVSSVILLTIGIVARRLQRPPRAALWWGLLVLWSGTTLLWAFDPEATWARLPTVVACFLFYLVAVSFRITREELAAVLLLAMLGGIVAAGYACWTFMETNGIDRATLALGDRTTNPNTFAAVLLLPLSLALGTFISSRGWFKALVMISAVALLSLAILLSMSRGDVIAAGVLLVVYIYRYGLRRRMLVVVSVVTLLLYVMPALFFARIETGMSSRAEGRFDIWQVGVTAFQHYGAFGAGLNNFPAVYNQFSGHAERFRGYFRDPHNIYLGVSVELGILGLLLFLMAVGSHFRALQRFYAAFQGVRPPMVVACEAACWAMLTAGLSGNFVWNKVFWIMWVYLTLAIRVADRETLSTCTCDRHPFTALMPTEQSFGDKHRSSKRTTF